jgi:hypothetical protein
MAEKKAGAPAVDEDDDDQEEQKDEDYVTLGAKGPILKESKTFYTKPL